MLKTVVFDFDGTIASTLDILVAAYNDIARKHRCKKVFGDDLERLRDSRPQELMREFGINPLKMIFLIPALRGKMKKKMKEIKLQQGIREALKELKGSGLVLGILTSNSQENVEQVLRDNDLEDTFAFVHSSRHLFGKDRALRGIMKERSLAAKEIAYIGDEVRDIEAAKRAEVTSIGVSWGFQTHKRLSFARPDYLFDSPKDLNRLILNQ